MTEKQNNNLKPRPPIVVVMGHIDHGKTTLLDYIRKTNVAGKEAGGITQSIGAYEIKVGNPPSPKATEGQRKITFIDTPGHEAFSKMRARGSQAADLAILVVAADEGVKLQTKEAISHIQAAKLPFIVAINKIDKSDINLEKVKNELTGAGVLLEGYGGNVSWQAVSAKTGQGVSELLDLILLAAEMENLKYNPQQPARGIIIEARIDNRRGIVVSAIVKDGVLRIGQEIATSTAWGKIKSSENFLGEKVDSLEPSAPALILGFGVLPQIGEEFLTGRASTRSPRSREIEAGRQGEAGETAIKLSTAQTDKNSEKIKLILKADNAGELEALSDVVKNTGGLEILSQGIGKINKNDWKLAINSQALIIGFRVKLDRTAENLSRISSVKVITSDIIYELVKKIEEYLALMTADNISGELEVLGVFGSPEKGKQIIGGRIIQGLIKNQQKFEAWRKERNFAQGRILNIQEQRKDVAEVESGKEVGLLAETDDIIKVGDILKFYELPKPAGG